MTKRIRPTIHTSRRRRRGVFTPTDLLKAPLLLAVFIVALLVASPVGAVNISFDNCLSEAKQDSKDLLFVPLWADASVKKIGKTWRVLYTLFGDVHGAQDDNPKIPFNDPTNEYWRDNDKKDGKIAETTDGKYGTTLLARFDSLTYELSNSTVNFCRQALPSNFSCPLSPRFKTLTPYVPPPRPHASVDFLLIESWIGTAQIVSSSLRSTILTTLPPLIHLHPYQPPFR